MSQAAVSILSPAARSISSRADKVRREISPRLDGKRRAELGQFLTPAPVAEFMAGLFESAPQAIDLLDAGAGAGALAAALVRRLCL